MDGAHDIGGMHGFGPVVREDNEPVFHAAWERRVFGMCFFGGLSRRNIERLPADVQFRASYYEKWLLALQAGLEDGGVATRAELEERMAQIAAAEDDRG